MRILDRYVLRNFLEPFLLCFFGFIAIWLVFDLYDNGQDFIEYKVPPKTIALFYASQLPAIILLSMPIGLLLALLFSLSKMSRHNEIISILTAGRSLGRTIVPLVVVALLCSGVCFWLNSELAPHAAGAKKQKLEEITRGEKKATDREIVEGHVFRDRMHNRTWFIRKMRPKPKEGITPPLEGVHVTQQNAEGIITRKWYASRASYEPPTAGEPNGLWKLNRGMIVHFDKTGDIVYTDIFINSWRIVKNWSETPQRIASAQFQAQDLSINELRDYLRYNSDFPATQLAPFRLNLADRWAFPWSCVVVVFLAAPLGVVYSRRGVLAGVAGSIFLFFGLILLRYLFLAFGKGGRLDPITAAWAPNLFFFTLGLLLLHFRGSNKELKLAFWR